MADKQIVTAVRDEMAAIMAHHGTYNHNFPWVPPGQMWGWIEALSRALASVEREGGEANGG